MVRLWVRDRFGAFVAMYFRIDSQADLTTIPIDTALREGIHFARDRPGIAYGLTGAVDKFRDHVCIRIAGREHEWLCDFVDSPASPREGRHVAPLPSVLGRAGFLGDYAVTIDTSFLILTRLGPLRRWWRRCLHAMWHVLGLIHPIDQPL
jgi:hypothetical protein